jgi:hypothetical protein
MTVAIQALISRSFAGFHAQTNSVRPGDAVRPEIPWLKKLFPRRSIIVIPTPVSRMAVTH